MPTIYIENKPYEVKPGKNLLETCLTLGFDLPYFCWHPALGSVGACRQCAVKVFKDKDDDRGKLIMSCMEPVAENQRISIGDPEALQFRENVIEWLMTNHPHDCAVCDEGGSCHLQDMTVMTGHAYRRFSYKKRTYRNQYLGPFINHEMNRCIQCYRCVRFYKDYAGGNDLDAFASKNNVYFGRHQDGTLESEFSGNLTEVCPTGVFTDKTLKEHYTRKWDLTNAPSICQHCSLGCNTLAGERYGSLRLITSRYHGQVNGYFLCDRGRFGYEFVNASSRIRKPFIRKNVSDRENILEEISQNFKQENVIGIGSSRASLESNFALKKLVGENNFYLGVSDREHAFTALALDILTNGPTHSASMKEVEKADAVLILGEDLTNTAPMLALAVRQSILQQPLQQVVKAKIPTWNDAAARELIQDQKGPLFIATVNETKLDEVATQTHRATPDDIARLGFTIVNFLDNTFPSAGQLSEREKSLAQRIATTLANAQRPVVISGTSSRSESVLKAAANIAWALHKQNSNVRIALTFPECNSLGLAMLGGHQLNEAFDRAEKGDVNTLIVLENDLYRHAESKRVDAFFKKFKQVVVIDHSHHATAEQAEIVIPAGTFAEADGTVVNNEGRAQRFFQVHEPLDDAKESWRWIMRIATAVGNAAISPWKNLDDVTLALSNEISVFKGVERVSPPDDFRVNGQKIPRESHRFSGRTAMLANVHVSEPKPPEDSDTPLSYTMEGYRGLPPSSVIPFFWSPGWNSVQSINKYQDEVGGELRGGDPGIRLIEPMNNQTKYFTDIPEAFKVREGFVLVMPLYHIFGSEELSSRGDAISERIPAPYIMINANDGSAQGMQELQTISLHINEQVYQLPVKLSSVLPRGVAGLPVGLPGVSFCDLPVWGQLKVYSEVQTEMS